jgi:hypothetical protein
MTPRKFALNRLKKDLLAVLLFLLVYLWAATAGAQQRANPDTSITLKTTNNELYRLNQLYQVASQGLLKSDMPVKDYVEFNKEFQALLEEWFREKVAQGKEVKK